MITKSTIETDNEVYKSRLEKIDAAYKAKYTDSSDTIDSLDSFFAHIEQIATLGDPVGEYLLMPLDEPLFEINANTRAITIPDHFKKYGISVQGDNLAETVFFIIDRYFDFTDLASQNNKIQINWSLAPSGGTKVTGCTDALWPMTNYAPTEDKEGGYIIFGWPIGKEMTTAKGTLTFSVSIFEEAAGEKIYSFNTTPATVSINEGLVLENATAVDHSASILARLVNSDYATGGATPIPSPVWTIGKNSDGKFVGIVSVSADGDYKAEVNMPTPVGDDGVVEEVALYAQAYAANASTLAYGWKKDDSALFGGNEVYLETADTEANTSSIYYKEVADTSDGAAADAVIYKSATEEEIENYFDPEVTDKVQLFEKFTKVVAIAPGSYKVTAQGENRISGDSYAQSAMVTSSPVIIPEAKKPAIEVSSVEVADAIALGYTLVEDSDEDKKDYVSAYLKTVNVYGLTSDTSTVAGKTYYTKTTTDGKEDYDEILSTSIDAAFNDGTAIYEVTGTKDEAILKAEIGLNDGMVKDDLGRWDYEWDYSTDNSNFDVEKAIDSDNTKWAKEAANELVISKEGFFKAKVEQYKNTTTAVSDDSTVYRVTKLVSPIAAKLASSANINLGSNASTTMAVALDTSAAGYDANRIEGGVTCQWQKSTTGDENSWVNVDKATDMSLKLYSSALASGSMTYYRAILTAVYNRSSISAKSEKISVYRTNN